MKILKSLTVLIVAVFLFVACDPTEVQESVGTQETDLATSMVVTEEPATQEIAVVETVEAIATQQTIQPPLPTAEEEIGPAKAIILFIGDGMGSNHRLGAQWLALGQGNLLSMDSMPVNGMMETSLANGSITDSAGAATALASGMKTNYLFVGMGPDRAPVETILEQAEVQGWATGLITTTPLTDATPAAFATHVTNRYMELEIAKQMAVSGVDVLLGGGEDDFLPRGVQGCFPKSGHRNDKVNLVDDALDEGYTLVCSGQELNALDVSSVTKLIGFFGDDELAQPYNPTLADMTRVAIEILSQDPDGFFLMVEGGQIDWESHDNHAREAMQLTVGLNAAVAMAQVYAVGEPDTLIIVTADHETGGMSLNLDCKGSYRQDGPFSMPDGTAFCVDWDSTHHTGLDVPVTAQGPWSWMLYGEYPNTWVYRVMYSALTGEGIGIP